MRRATTWVLAFVAAACVAAAPAPQGLPPATPASVGMDAAALDKAVELYREAVNRDDLRGAVLYVARRGKVVLHEAVGFRHHANKLPMQKDTLFRMASNTKPVVAAAVLLLADEGKLALSDPASKFLKSFDNDKSRRITIDQLLTHSSGFRIGPIAQPFAEGEERTLQVAVSKLGAIGPAEAPGSYSYSNAGYNTLGAIIEVVSGQPLEDFLKARIYTPLGMIDSLNHEDPTKLARMATVYRGAPGANGIVFTQEFTPGDGPDLPFIRASGGLISTANDYARFLEMYRLGGVLEGRRILNPETVRAAVQPRVKTGGSSAYGHGWGIRSDGSYGHEGSDGTLVWVDPAREIIGLVLTPSPGGRNPVAEFRALVEESIDRPDATALPRSPVSPSTSMGPSGIVRHVLDALDLGQRPGYVVISDADVTASFPQAGAAWVGAAPAPARQRREQVAAAALLFLAFRALDADRRLPRRPETIGASEGVRSLIEKECARMRRGQLGEFERRWLLASLALVEWSGDRVFLTGAPDRSCDSARSLPCDHLSHVRTRLPSENLVQLAASTVPGAIAERHPCGMEGLLERFRFQPNCPSPPRVPAAGPLESGLRALLADPVVGTDARLRLGLLKYSLNQRRESLDELARVIGTSPHREERVVAHWVSALIHDADLRPADALQSLENAIAVMPHVRSIALSVATRYHLAGRVDDAATLIDATFAADPPAFDPLRARYAIWTWYQSLDRLLELFR